MITVAFETLTKRMLHAAPAFSTAEPPSGTPLPSPEPSVRSSPNLYTLDECFYQVNTSGIQKAVYGIVATSLVINFGILVWWSRLYFYKRKHRRSEEEDYPAEKDMDEIFMDDLDMSSNQSARPRRVVINASNNAVTPVEEGYGGRGGPRSRTRQKQSHMAIARAPPVRDQGTGWVQRRMRETMLAEIRRIRQEEHGLGRMEEDRIRMLLISPSHFLVQERELSRTPAHAAEMMLMSAPHTRVEE